MLCFSWSSKHDRCKNDRWRIRMAKVTLVFAVLLIALGVAGFLGTGSTHYTALIPAWIGLALGIGGWLAISPDERRRKLFMHINVTIGLVRSEEHTSELQSLRHLVCRLLLE